MRLFRPFLSYADLGKLLHGKPSEMHDSLHNVLGLGRLADVENRLKTVRRDSDLGRKHAANDLPALREALADHPDDRARAAEQLLALSTVDLEALEKLASGAETDGHDNDVVSSLEALAALILPGREELAANVTRLREAAVRVAELSQTPAGEARRLADLLRDALRHQQHHPDQPCPVCGGRVLDDAWTARAQEQITRLEEEAAHLTHAHQALQQARLAVRQMAHTAPPVLTAPAPGLEIDLVALRNAWRDWEGLGSAETDGLIEGALARFDAVAVALSPTRDAAERALEKRRAAWQPMADRLREWVGTERRSRQAAQTYVAARKAVEWLVSVGEQIRNKRLAPMATEARKIWAALRQDSNVDLGVVTLAGTGNRRRVNLNLAVDGEADAALGVMSQGELHALALALFLPRATAAASPLRFLLIDDPVQSLDPSKVQGLARVLEAAAAERQVIVFTHDDRLPTAIRHLGINAHLRVVSRRERSQVTVINDAHGDPARRHLAAARGVALDEKLDQALQTKVVCVLVRQAIEAKCHDLVLIDGARRGRPVAELEDTLAATARLKQTLALALFGDAARAGDVNRRLRKLHPRAATVVDHVNRGSHGDPVPGDLTALVSDARTLIDRLEAR